MYILELDFKVITFTLIVPGKVQVDPANFDVKLQKKLLCTFEKTYSYTMSKKLCFDIYFNDLMSKIQL
jgi:hypothetical protein